MRKELLWGLMAGLAAALPGAPTALRWTGGGGDFNFATAANWDGDAGAFASEEGVTLDLTDVPDGAVLTNDFTASKSCRLAGVTLAAGRTVELFGASASKSTLRLVKATTFTVPPGAELRFNLQMANPWEHGGLTHRIEGGGTFRFLSPLFVPWGCTFAVGAETTFCHDSTVFDVGGASALGQTAVTLADSTARLVLARDMAVAAVTCAADATPHIVLNGHVLRLTGGSGGNGFSVRGLEGAGVVAAHGGVLGSLALPADGALALEIGDSGVTLPSLGRLSALVVDGSGFAACSNDLSVGALLGRGLTGGLVVEAGKTLSFEGTAEGTNYAATIVGGGGVRKTGAGLRQTLSGRCSYAGETVVEAGVLTLDATGHDVGLPVPAAHWAFDEAADAGRDSGPNGCALSPVSKAAALKDDTRSYGRYLDGASSSPMTLAGGCPAAFPSGARPFTVSVRYRMRSCSENQALLAWGDPEAGRYFQIGFTSCPRYPAFWWGADPKSKSPSLRLSSWYHAGQNRDGVWMSLVATYDPATRQLVGYRDGTRVGSSSNVELSLGRSAFFVGANINGENGAYVNVDDLRIFDAALSPDQVAALVRALETGAAGPVLPAASPVTVAAGATLEAKGVGHRLHSLSGAGTVALAARAEATLESGDAFAGTLQGDGTLTLAEGASLGRAARVETDVRFTARLAFDGRAPLVTTTGRVFLPEKGTLVVTRGEALASGVFVLAQAAEVVAPPDFAGWTVEGLKPGVRTLLGVRNGQFRLNVCGGTCLIFR